VAYASFRRFFAATVVLTLAVTTAAGASDEATSAAACERTPRQVFVSTAYGTECIRYFVSAGVSAHAPMAVFHFHGDVRRDIAAAPQRVGALARGFQIRADATAARLGSLQVYIGRPGLFGSTGDHARKREPKEFHSLNAALDKIKARFGIERIALSGQSGGGSVVGALLSLGRTDIVCAVPGSGAFDLAELYTVRRARDGKSVTDGRLAQRQARLYSPIEHVDQIPKDPNRRIFVVGDPRDSNTFFSQQREFAERVKAAGHHVVLLSAPGTGPKKHEVGRIANEIASLCLQGRSDAEIKQAVAELWTLERKRPPKVERPSSKPEVPPAAPVPAR
jgi:Prolyl oligopeptidase family